MEKVTFKVPAINCMHCVNTIQTELMEMDGVQSVSADPEIKTVEVDYQEPATIEKLKVLLAEINYPAAE